ncbi:MAG TPA: DoxX family protein [Rhodanobacter sp.]|nr:DoxX family protein [Rhodanobacter sp.]
MSISLSHATHDSRRWLPVVHWLALLALCAAYLQGGVDKLRDFPAAIGEMQHFGLHPAPLFAAVVIALELIACALILFTHNHLRWYSALALAAFTLAASLLANAFWNAPPAQQQMMANGFFEHIGLAGGFVLVALLDSSERNTSSITERPGA